MALRWAGIVLGLLLLLLLPMLLQTYLTSVLDTVGRFVLLGLGLNIVVGFAGLLDLGYVAFYAIGAYTVAVLTTTSPALGGAEVSFWLALPIAIGASVLASILLGLPALRIRGDYLAIVTLGFGQVVGKLATSSWLKTHLGGAQGIVPIPRPIVFGQELGTFQSLYYLILVGCAIAFYISWRLRDSRLGLIWMATRDDEDVAGALGIDLLKTRLLAFAIGAAFAGAGGAIFATQATSIYPQDFQLAISINVLCLIVVGGIGNLPGVIVGSLLMVGLPEAVGELLEYRTLYLSATLVLAMLVRFGHLLPRASREREWGTGADH